MQFALYSLSLVIAFSIARWVSENIKFHVRNKKLWVHHWILAAAAMMIIYILQFDEPWLWGGLTGVALEGLRRENWSLFR
jgi:H+/Cl- antiporter ClcA